MTGILPKRALRGLLVVAASLAAIGVFLLATATENTELFAQGYDTLVVVNIALVTILMLIVGWQLWRLARDRGRGVFGSRLASRLVFAFALVAVLPGALVYAVSVNFLGRSIESWFDVRVDRALEGGLALGRNSLEYLSRETTNKAQQMADRIGEGTMPLGVALSRAAAEAGVGQVAIFNSAGGALAVAGGTSSSMTPESPPPQALRRARLQQTFSVIEPAAGGGLQVRVVVPVNTADRLEPLKVMQVIEPVPPSLAQEIEKAEVGFRDYQEISFARAGLKRLYALTLTLALLTALSVALGIAVILSERLSAPLGLLAEGTRAVAQGDFSRRQPVVSRDEFGLLTGSFNAMTEQLADARARNEESRRAIETTRAYLESVLANLSAGVLAFDDRYRLRTANPSASVILQQPLTDLSGVALGDWGARLPALGPFAEMVVEGFRGARDGQWQREAALSVANLSRSLLMRGTRLPGTPNPGYVLVFDDVSELVQAQRDAAWGEVARRLAHEIKNPLTPIQLAAERLAMKLEPKLDGPEREALKRGTQTIVNQVGAMKQMVDDFAVYAKHTRPGQAKPVDLSALLLDVLALYDNLRPHVTLALPDAPVVVPGEPTRLRQVLHNLLQNAIDAQADRDEKSFVIRLSASDGEARLSVADAGPGFAADVMARAFEPYVTTKAKGTGLGLAIVKKIVDEHGGRVAIANVEPHGASVTLTLPLAPVAAPVAPAAVAGEVRS